MQIIKWFSTPKSSSEINRKNFVNVQIDAIGVGLASAASPFLPVYLTRIGATNLQVSLLTTMPAITGLLLALILGRFLQSKKNIVPWFSTSRLLVLSSYAMTGIASLIVPEKYLVISVLLIWAWASIPQTILSISFSVVMNSVAGPAGRYELMTRRWSILGLTTSVTVFIIGQLLDRIAFPLNYQVIFIGLSLGGLISFYFSSHLELPELSSTPPLHGHSIIEKTKDYFSIIRHEKEFVSFIIKRLVYSSGTAIAAPMFPLYFVRQIQASDSWIAAINTTQTAIVIVGYFFWTVESKRKGSRSALLWTTFGLSFYPILTAFTTQPWIIMIYAAFAGIFQAGINLVFFDELMKTVPVEYSATFVSFAQSVDYLSAIAAPIIGSMIADQMGLSFALVISGILRLFGYFLFLTGKQYKKELSPV